MTLVPERDKPIVSGVLCNAMHLRIRRAGRYPAEYAIANEIDHSPAVHLREVQIVDHLDRWLARGFAPGQIEQPLAMLESTQPRRNPEAEAARRMLTEHNPKLVTYREALEAGTDPQLVVSWTSQVPIEKQMIGSRISELDRHAAGHVPMTGQEIKSWVDSLSGLPVALGRADPEADATQAVQDSPRLERWISRHRCGTVEQTREGNL